MAYGYIGSIKAKAGRRDEVVSILPSGVDGLREAGCHLFIVGSSNADDDTIWASEVWKSKQHAVVANSKPLLGTNATGTHRTVHDPDRLPGPGVALPARWRCLDAATMPSP